MLNYVMLLDDGTELRGMKISLNGPSFQKSWSFFSPFFSKTGPFFGLRRDILKEEEPGDRHIFPWCEMLPEDVEEVTFATVSL